MLLDIVFFQGSLLEGSDLLEVCVLCGHSVLFRGNTKWGIIMRYIQSAQGGGCNSLSTMSRQQ